MLQIIIICSASVFAQVNTDSLWNIYQNKSQPDSVRFMSLEDMTFQGVLFSNPDSALSLGQIGFEDAEALGEQFYAKNFLNIQGIALSIKGHFDEAREIFKETLHRSLELNDFWGAAGALSNMGVGFENQGKYLEAIQVYDKLLEGATLKQDTVILYSVANNIANVFQILGDHEKAFDYYQMAYDLQMEKMGEVNPVIINSLGSCYANKGDYETAKEYMNKALDRCHEVGDSANMSLAYNNLADVYMAEGDEKRAIAALYRSIAICEKLGLESYLVAAFLQIGTLHLDAGRYNEAYAYNYKGYELATDLHLLDERMNGANNLYTTYKRRGDYTNALIMHEVYVALRDSVQNDENSRALINQTLSHEYEKKEALAETEHQMELERREAVALSEKERQSAVILIVSIGLVLVILLLLFLFNRFRFIQLQKKVIEDQKGLVEQKNQEIVDSISYAKRIQSAILPEESTLNKYLADSFVLYLPKDIVAGDFYWLEKTNDQVLFAVADCTGHGVPGAMVSVVCNNALNRTTREFKLTEPGKILDKTNELVEDAFSASTARVRDGMDIALCSLSEVSGTNKRKIRFAGAHNPFCYVKDGELKEIKADKQPIGSFNDHVPYNTHEIELEAGTMIYIFSDGFADQFGGPEGKKFKYKRLRELLLSISTQALQDQKTALFNTFEEWKRDLDQLDDICIMGVRI